MSFPNLDLTNNETRPKVALVLGTGGVKALAGFSFFEFLNERGIPIDLSVGSSGGAIACAAMGAGWSPEDARREFFKRFNKQVFSQFDYRSILGIFSSKLGNFDKTTGILKPDRLRAMFQDFFGELRIEQLSPRTLIQTTDVTTGEGVVLSKGPLAEAVYASCAFFPALPPAKINGRLLGDGVYSAPVPVMEATKRNIDVIIALNFKENLKSDPKGFFASFYRHIDNTMNVLTRSQMFMSIHMHHHEIVAVDVNFDHAINPWDLNEAQYIIDAGRKAVEESKMMILSALETQQKRKTGLLQKNPAAAHLMEQAVPPPPQLRTDPIGSSDPEPRRTVVIPEDKGPRR